MPCSVWRVLAALIVMGSWRRCTRSSYTQSLPGLGSATSTWKLPRDSCGCTATQPGLNAHRGHVLSAPAAAWAAQEMGGNNSVLTSSS